MSKTIVKDVKSATDGSLALPPAFLEKKKPVKAVVNNPYQPFLDKFFPDGNFTKEEMEGLCKNLIEMKLQYQQYCDPIQAPQELYAQACSNDGITITSWKDQWMAQAKENEQEFESSKHTVMSESGKYKNQPGIIAGSGPSLRKNFADLKDRRGISLTSCAHNFAFFTDKDVHPEYYVQLDAGHIIIPELSQGGKKPKDYYWDATKDYTLIASVVTNPQFVRKWKGKVLWYNTVVPDGDLYKQMFDLNPTDIYFQSGGNALGACFYMSRAVLGCTPTVLIGADFSFGYNQKFHPFDSPYDSKFSGVVPCTDVYGNRVATWPSYQNFAKWFEFQSMGGNGGNPTFMINCTEGGILGATPHGNINTIKQMSLKALLFSYNMTMVVVHNFCESIHQICHHYEYELLKYYQEHFRCQPISSVTEYNFVIFLVFLYSSLNNQKIHY